MVRLTVSVSPDMLRNQPGDGRAAGEHLEGAREKDAHSLALGIVAAADHEKVDVRVEMLRRLPWAARSPGLIMVACISLEHGSVV